MEDFYQTGERDVVARGIEAWTRHKKDNTWNGWMEVGETLDVGRRVAMRQAFTNQPKGKGYNDAYGRWLRENGFIIDGNKDESLHETTRARLLSCVENRGAIEAWRATLPLRERMRLNHPESVWKKWSAYEKAKAVDPDVPGKPKKPGLKEEVVALQEENDALNAKLRKMEAAASKGSLLEPSDNAKNIARVLIENLSTTKADEVAKVLAGLVKERRAAAKVKEAR